LFHQFEIFEDTPSVFIPHSGTSTSYTGMHIKH